MAGLSFEPQTGVSNKEANAAFKKGLNKVYGWYTGGFIAFVSTAISFFYSVVVGWCIYYFIRMLTHPLPLDIESSMAVWNSFQSGAWPFVLHAMVMLAGGLIIRKGVSSIERFNMIFIPILLVIVLLCVIRALTLPGAWAGVSAGAYTVAVPGPHSREHDFRGVALVANSLADARIYRALGLAEPV